MASLREDAVVAMEQDNRNEHDPTAIRIVTEPDGRLAGFIKRTDKEAANRLLGMEIRRLGFVSSVFEWNQGSTFGIKVESSICGEELNPISCSRRADQTASQNKMASSIFLYVDCGW